MWTMNCSSQCGLAQTAWSAKDDKPPAKNNHFQFSSTHWKERNALEWWEKEQLPTAWNYAEINTHVTHGGKITFVRSYNVVLPSVNCWLNPRPTQKKHSIMGKNCSNNTRRCWSKTILLVLTATVTRTEMNLRRLACNAIVSYWPDKYLVWTK